ncbi:TrkH family potassium uptake protein [Mahella australiensis]|uniref:Potassium uptake protein, TrkH family n=1 Tax=Mahella australiensis (strain DSM 15567 / CIP 107919 / 50-1 BON) TaxID=697281 RepID=F4A083_MAHA5|nr:potassium uptake protein, TrkH family [Mahella australiensis 50-1 BON]
MTRFTPTQILVMGFAAIILTGTLLLMLPISSAAGQNTDFITSLFTATSAVCVTGLVVVDTGTYWSLFGQIVIMLLIQAGGLGFMTMATLASMLLGRRIGLKERLVIQEALNEFSLQGLVKLTQRILITTALFELSGMALLSTRFIPIYGIGKGLYFSLFHAVSAFNNAGFDIIGDFVSFTPFVGDIIINFTVMGLIIIGGIGFAVIMDVFYNWHVKRLSLHTKLVLTTTTVLIVAGFLFFFFVEYNNPKTLGPLSVPVKAMAALFQSITPRTAGFNTISEGDLTDASKFVTILLMYTGASPASTGGGIKTTTLSTIILAVAAVLRGRENVNIYGKRLSWTLVMRSLSIAVLALGLISAVTIILSLAENQAFIKVLFETVSAFGTVGLSTGITPTLSAVSKIALAFTMFAGRVGPLTIAVALLQRQHGMKDLCRYPEEKIMVG